MSTVRTAAESDVAGAYDTEWLATRWPHLPEDFDTAYWNGAHPDMRIPHLAGGEEIMLTNLTPEGALTFRLPGHLPLLQARYRGGRSGSVFPKLDTLIIEPDARNVSLVWRAVLPIQPETAVVEALLT